MSVQCEKCKSKDIAKKGYLINMWKQQTKQNIHCIAEAIYFRTFVSPQLDSEGAFLCSNTFRIAICNELNIVQSLAPSL